MWCLLIRGSNFGDLLCNLLECHSVFVYVFFGLLKDLVFFAIPVTSAIVCEE